VGCLHRQIHIAGSQFYIRALRKLIADGELEVEADSRDFEHARVGNALDRSQRHVGLRLVGDRVFGHQLCLP
jgi:hypothetical protein